MAKISPKASTRNPKSIPGNTVKGVNFITAPLTIRGAMDMMSKNCVMLASIVQLSLMFGRLPNNIIRIEPIAGHRIANSGLIDSTISVTASHPPAQIVN